MKKETVAKPQRRYKQKARAQAAAATGEAIVASFLKRLGDQWFEDITLDSVAEDAGVTGQTVIRRFGGKAGLLEAAIESLGELITVRREIRHGDVAYSVEVLSKDYEEVGDLVIRLLAQEERHEVIKPFADLGRRGHRDWLESVFADSLKSLTPARKEAKLDALVIATDVYIWKLVRRDMGRPVAAFKAHVTRMLNAALQGK